MQPFLGIPLSPCLICGIIQDIKNIHISRDIHFKAFFFFLAVCWGELAWYCFFPYQKFPSLPGKQDFEYGRKLPFITYGMVEYVCVYERESERERAQSCLTLCYPMDCGSSVRGILQARIRWWVAISSSRGSS